MKAAIFTISTSMYKTGGESMTATSISEMLEEFGFEICGVKALPSERQVISTVLKQLSDSNTVDLILTLGANGHTKSECAPDAVSDIIDRALPGICEAIRAYNLNFSNRAMLDRSVAGICNQTLIVNLPNKEKAATEDLDYILSELIHVIETIAL